MNIEFVCEHCGRPLNMEDYLGGQSVECYHCHASVVVPQQGERAVIEFQCLGCGTPFRVPSSRAGHRSKCPKCLAVLVVPDPGASPAPPTGFSPRRDDISRLVFEAPPPPPVRARPPLAGRRGAAPFPPAAGTSPSPAGAQTEFLRPSKTGPSVGWILFWVALGLFLMVAVVVLIASKTKQEGAAANYVQIYAQVKYNQALGVFQVANLTMDVWHEVTFTIETTSGNFFFRADELRPNEPMSVTEKQFTSKGGVAFDGPTMTSRRFIITARLSSGGLGQFVLKWSGPRPE